MDVADILSHPDISRDIQSIEDSKSKPDQETSLFLEQLSQAIIEEKRLVKEAMAQSKSEINHIQKRAEASMAYLKPQRSKKKDK